MRRAVLITVSLILGLSLAGCAGWRDTRGVKLTAIRGTPTPTASTKFVNDTDYRAFVQWEGLLDPGDHFEIAARDSLPFVFTGKTGKWREFTITQFRDDYSSGLGQEENKVEVKYTGLYDVGNIHITDTLILGHTIRMGIVWNNSPEDLVAVRDSQWPQLLNLKAGEWTEARTYADIETTWRWRPAHNQENLTEDMKWVATPPRNRPTRFNGIWYGFVVHIDRAREVPYFQ